MSQHSESFHIQLDQPVQQVEIQLPASKSESNRALVINALQGGESALHNLSLARDTRTMQHLLGSHEETWDVKDAGTTMRFLTAYSGVSSKRILTGTDRMKERPIKPLGDALRLLGCTINYLGNEGYPPLEVIPITIQKTSHIQMPGDISSQYISALMMIAPLLKDGLTIEFTTKVMSRPYILMTSGIMKSFGAEITWEENTIHIPSQEYKSTEITIESDWSAASYWYGIAAMNPDSTIVLPGLRQTSFQGDSVISAFMRMFGVETTFTDQGLSIQRTLPVNHEIELDFSDCPDLAQTIMAVATGLRVSCRMTGLQSLRIKETDRIQAMQTELEKFGAILTEEDDSWLLIPPVGLPEEEISISTYHDHRMAMALSILGVRVPLRIEDPEVVDKSYPHFWEDLEKAGFNISS